MRTHEQVIKKLLRRPGVRTEVERIERSLATGKHSPSIVTLRRYVKACGKRLHLRVA